MTAKPVLLVDYGASRVKAAVFDPVAGVFLGSRDTLSPVPTAKDGGRVEIDPAAYPAAFTRLAAELAEFGPFAAIWLCSEMHGFLLLDGQDRPLTPYISWRDSRGSGATLDSLGAQIGPLFRAETGMRLKSGLPYLNAFHMAERGEIAPNSHLVTLPEWVVAALGRRDGVVDQTMAAGTGFYSLTSGEWSDGLLAHLRDRTGCTLGLDRVKTDQSIPLGSIGDVPVYGGIGDLQAAVLGSGTPAHVAANLNLGTGSQVNIIGLGGDLDRVESRPFFDGLPMATISHIPSGRMFRAFETLFDGIAALAGGQMGALWPLLADISADQALAASLRLDLNIFPGAWQWNDGGAITGLREGGMGPRDLAAGLILAYARQYADALALMDPQGQCTRLVLSGGMPRRIPALASVLETITGRTASLPPDGCEETLDGLAKLAVRTG